MTWLKLKTMGNYHHHLICPDYGC